MRFAEMTQEVEVARPIDRPIYGLAAGRRHRARAFKDELSQRLEERGRPSSAGKSPSSAPLVLLSHAHMSDFKNVTQLFPLPVDDPALMNQLVESLPALPHFELLDPADDQSLPRLIEILERRLRVRQMMSEQFDKTGMGAYSELQIVVYNGAIFAGSSELINLVQQIYLPFI